MTLCLALAALTAMPGAAARSSPTLDPAFGVDGRVATDFSGRADTALAVAVAQHGQIVVAGYTQGAAGDDLDVALLRYEQDGTLDTSFGLDGRVVTDLGAAAGATGVAVLAGGEILVAGTIARAPGENDFLLLRYDSDGRLDPTFGEQGVVVADFFDTNDTAVDMAVLPNGDVVVAGTIEWDGTGVVTDLGVARFTRDGSLDRSFGVAGRVVVDFGATERAHALAVRPNGEAVVAGTTMSPSGRSDVVLAGLTRHGHPDARFGGGRVVTDLGPDVLPGDLALAPDGSVVLAGTYRVGAAGGDFLVARYLRSGAADPSFGTAGRVTTDFGLGTDAAFAVRVRPDGTIVAAGRTSRTALPPTHDDFALARYQRDGRLDGDFGGGGLVITDFRGINDEVRALALLPGGGLVAAGTTWDAASADFAVAAYR